MKKLSKRVVNLYRVSSLKQYTSGDSLEDQKKICDSFNDREQNKKVNEFEVVETGTDKERLQFDQIIQYCRNPRNQVDALVFKSIDRFTRAGSYKYSYLKKELAKSGIELMDAYGFIQPNKNSLEHLGFEYEWSKYSPSENAEEMYANNAKQEVRDILTRMIGAEITYTQEGYSCRKAPMGFENIRVETKIGKRLVYIPHQTESVWMTAMFNLRAEGKSDNQIVKQVNKLGFKTRERILRNRFTREIIKKLGNTPLTIKQLQRYIKNSIYAGYRLEKWTNGKLIKTQNKGLVSIQVYNQANKGKFVIVETESGAQLLKDQDISSGRKIRNKNNPNFPFKDILCPICNETSLASSPRSKSGKHVPYYHCCRGHPRWSVPKKLFEDNVYEFIRKIDFSPEYAQLFKDVVLSVWERKKKKLFYTR